MKKFVFKVLSFLSFLLILPLCILVLDPFDYYTHSYRLRYDRIHIVRQRNVADWALSEVEKISKDLKSKSTTIAIGDSRGRVLISNGFENGWKGRILERGSDILYDLNFGGAHLEESFSLFDREIVNCPNVKSIIITLPIDRLINMPYNRNRIQSSMFNSNTPNLSYLTNWSQLGYFLTKNKAGPSFKPKDPKVWEKIEKQFFTIFEKSRRSVFNANLADFNSEILELNRNDKYKIIIFIPPYEPIFFERITANFGDDYEYFLGEIMNLPYTVYNLQKEIDKFDFVDPVHGKLKKGPLTDLLN